MDTKKHSFVTFNVTLNVVAVAFVYTFVDVNI